MKRKYTREYKKIDFICICVIGSLFFAFALMNLLIGPWKTGHIEGEKRDYASFPELTVRSLFLPEQKISDPDKDSDGSGGSADSSSKSNQGAFAAGVNNFFNDHFLFREGLIGLSKKFDLLYGVSSDFTIISGGQKVDQDAVEERDKAYDKMKEDQTEPAETTEPIPDDGTVVLSKKAIKLAVGSSTNIFLAGDYDTSDVKWSVDSSGTIELVSSDSQKANIKAISEGAGTLTCRVGNEELTCTVSVDKLDVQEGGDVESIFQNGLFIYDGAVYTPGFYSAENFSKLVDVGVYYKNLFGADRMTVCVGPTSGIMIENDNFNDILIDYSQTYSDMSRICSEKGVNFPNICEEILGHRDEYLYYKTDHHWTDRGAYYAYASFAKSVGFEPTPIEDFKVEVLSETYQGSMYDYTQNEIVKSFYDTVEAYIPTKAHTMTILTKQGEYQTFDSSIMTWSTTYAAFLCGDNPYTVINVPENPQDLNILVLKDSFGNAFIPYLAEHYGNIYVVDARYSAFNIKEFLGDIHFSDILFVNNLEASGSPAWQTLYLKAVGITG